MKVSLTGMLHNAADALPQRAYKAAAGLRALESPLRALHADRAEGEAAIDRFLGWYMRNAPIPAAVDALPSRPTVRCSQPGLVRFGLQELAGNIAALAARKAEGTAVLDAFFGVYVFEGRDGGER
jgi:hypothetical protein